MKKYYVTVNGNRYEVEVEEVKGDFGPSLSTATTSNVEPKNTIEKVQEAPKEVKKEEVAPKQEVVNAEGEKIECPMPGTILSVNVSEGAEFKKGDVLFILEAMKMENEIMAPRDGKMVKVAVAKGATVNTGDLLAVIQ